MSDDHILGIILQKYICILTHMKHINLDDVVCLTRGTQALFLFTIC